LLPPPREREREREEQLDGSENVIRSVPEIQTCVTFKTNGRMFNLKTIPPLCKSMDVKIIPQIRIPGTFTDIPHIGENWHKNLFAK
jgi:hypothetical protein